MADPGVEQCTTCTTVLGSPRSLPPGAYTWPTSSLSPLCWTGVRDRRTLKPGKDVLGGGGKAGDPAPGLRRHSWDACAPLSSPGTCYANRQGPTHNGSRQPAGQPAPPPPPPHPIVLPSAGAVGAPEQDPGFSPGQEGLLGWLGMPERMSDCADEMRGAGVGRKIPQNVRSGHCPTPARPSPV